MTFKLLGAILVFLGCGGVGVFMAANHRREENALRQMLTALDYMECELQYRLTPLPQLCRKTAENSGGYVRKTFLLLAQEMENQFAPDVLTCMNAVIQKNPQLPEILAKNLQQMGHFLGRFGLDGQIQGIETVRQLVGQDLQQLCCNKEARLRCYQTLGFCAGSALVVIFI